jgi:hypothetical protein
LFLANLDVLPAAHGITIINSAAADSSGGSTAVPRLSLAARDLGFRVIAVLDWDSDAAQAGHALAECMATAHAVIRLPHGDAIENALLDGLQDVVVRNAIQEVAAAYGIPLPAGFAQLNDKQLNSAAIAFLKSSAGFHAQFVDTLPDGVIPPLAEELLRSAVLAAQGAKDGHIQL